MDTLLLSNQSISGRGGIQTYRLYLIEILLKRKMNIDFFYRDNIDNEQLRDDIFFMNFKKNNFFNKIKYLFRVIFKKYDLILITHINYSIFAVFFKILRKKNIIIFLYGIDAINLSRRKKFFSNFCDLIITHSDLTRENFISNYKDFSKMVVSVGGPYLKTPHVRKIEEKKIIISTVTRLTIQDSYKNVNKVIIALNKIRDESSIPFIYNIIGEGDDKKNLELLSEKLGMNDVIKFHGWIDNEKREKILSETDIYVLPSEGEGFGLSFIEAVSKGCDVIGSVKDGSREALNYGEFGYLVDPDDQNKIKEVINMAFDKNNNNNINQKKLWQEYGFETFQKKLNFIFDKYIYKNNDILIFGFSADKNKSISNFRYGISNFLFWENDYKITFFNQKIHENLFLNIFNKYIYTSLKVLFLNFRNKYFNTIIIDQGLAIYKIFYFKEIIIFIHDLIPHLSSKNLIKTNKRMNLFSKLNYTIYLLSLKRIKKVYFSSMTTKDDAERLGIPKKNLKKLIYPVFHITYEKMIFSNKIYYEPIKLPYKKKIMTIITSNAWYKDDVSLKNIIKQLNHKDIHFVVISLNKTKDIEALRIFKNLSICYGISNFNKNYLLSKSSFLLFNTKYEGFGLPPLEAMKYSNVVFASSINHLKRIYDKYIQYFDINNIEILRKNLFELLKDENKLITFQKKSLEGYNIIIEKFNTQKNEISL